MSNAATPSASQANGATSPGAAGQGGGGGRTTNVDQLLDAVGIAGVDIGAEEEGLRAVNERLAPPHGLTSASSSNAPSLNDPRYEARKQTFIESQVLATVVKKIAATYQLKTLEPDTIPFVAIATRHRLLSLLSSAIDARDHRVGASHLRPPPLVAPERRRGGARGAAARKRRRAKLRRRKAAKAQNGDVDLDMDDVDDDEDDDEDGLMDLDVDDDGEDDDDDDDEDEDDSGSDFDEDRRKRRATTTLLDGSVREPAWDALIMDEPEKVHAMLQRVEKEDERRARRARMVRDEQEERERKEQEEMRAAETSANGGEGASASGGADGMNEEGTKPKKERKKKEKPVSAKNMSEDVRKRLTDQTALASMGGRSFAWASGGAAPSPLGPRGGGGDKGKGASSQPGTPTAGADSGSAANLARLANVPPRHDANRLASERAAWATDHKLVQLSDLLFAVDRERGTGVDRGSGKHVLKKTEILRGSKAQQ